MKSRRGFLAALYLVMTAFLTSLVVAACGGKPDAETEPSPEGPPKEEE